MIFKVISKLIIYIFLVVIQYTLSIMHLWSCKISLARLWDSEVLQELEKACSQNLFIFLLTVLRWSPSTCLCRKRIAASTIISWVLVIARSFTPAIFTPHISPIRSILSNFKAQVLHLIVTNGTGVIHQGLAHILELHPTVIWTLKPDLATTPHIQRLSSEATETEPIELTATKYRGRNYPNESQYAMPSCGLNVNCGENVLRIIFLIFQFSIH